MSISAAFGTSFSWNGETIAELKTINGIELTVATTDVTTHQSEDSYVREIPTFITPGDVTLEGFFSVGDSNGQIAMMADFNDKVKHECVITFPIVTGTSWTFDAYITAIKIGDAPIDGMLPFTATVKPYGKPVFATATSVGLTTAFFAISESAVIIPAPANAVYTYTASVLTGIESVIVTPTATTGVITVNGDVVATGVASSAITLGAAGSITEVVIVVTEENKAPITYTIFLARA